MHTPGSQGNAIGQRSAYPHRVVIETSIKISEMLLKGENRSQKRQTYCLLADCFNTAQVSSLIKI